MQEFTVIISGRHDTRMDGCSGRYKTRQQAVEHMETLVTENLQDLEYSDSEIEEYFGSDESIDTPDATFSIALLPE